MSIQPIIPSLNNNAKKKSAIKIVPQSVGQNSISNNYSKQVSFQGAPVLKSPNIVVGLMDFIAAGGFAASFIIQDGIGFILPRVGKGLFRGGKEKRDENGDVILDKNGKPKHELNWAYARKEGIREIITGPSAFVIPWLALKGINKYGGTGNSVKINYIDSFQNAFTDFANANKASILEGKQNKFDFYRNVFKDVIERSINENPNADKMSAKEILDEAKRYADKQINIETILADKTLSKKERKAKLARLGSIEDDFMLLRKSRIGGKVNELAASFTTSKQTVQSGSIGELVGALDNYYQDALNTVKTALKKDGAANIADVLKHFTSRRMGSRILTNIGLFLTVAAFYTQIPKLYNMGLKGNPALANQDSEPALQNANNKKPENRNKKDVNFTGLGSALEKAGDKVFNGKKSKYVSDLFEFDGPVIQGAAMSILLYGACIPPRIINAQDKYDLNEIVVRDFTAFTALLFGAKALARLFSDGFTKLTGLALNDKNTDNMGFLRKAKAYLRPSDQDIAVLSSKQLNSKYTNIDNYKGGINGFIEFIEQSGGNVKKAFSHDKNVVKIIEKIIGKSYGNLSADEIKSALSAAHKNKSKEINEFYKLFTKENGLLNRAKTCNSAFGFLSTIVLVPGLIWALTDICKYMTDKRKAKDDAEKALNINASLQAPVSLSKKPSMSGFLGQQG